MMRVRESKEFNYREGENGVKAIRDPKFGTLVV